METLTLAECMNIYGGCYIYLGGMLYDLTFHTGETIESFNAGRDAANAMWNK